VSVQPLSLLNGQHNSSNLKVNMSSDWSSNTVSVQVAFAYLSEGYLCVLSET
jgi:hypothetical protein